MYQNSFLDSGSRLYSHQITHFDGNQLVAEPALHVYYVLEGDCYVQYHQSTQFIRENELFFFPANTPYAIYTGNAPAVYYRLSILDEFFDANAPELKHMQFDQFYLGCSRKDGIYHELCHLLACIVFSMTAERPISSFAQTTYVNRLILFLYQEFHAQSAPDYSGSYSALRINKIIAFIRQNYDKKLTLDTISREFGLHPQYFSSFFLKHFHVKFTDFLNQYRINQSLHDLIYTDQTILAIALDHGFSSHKSYSNSFQKYYHTSPSAYRQNNRPTGTSALDSPMRCLSALYAYYDSEPKAAPALPEQVLSLALDLKKSPRIAENRCISSIGLGSGYYLLQDNVYEQLKRAAKECAFTHVHIRDPFCDMMNVYTEPQPDHPLYYWESLDLVLERITGLGFYPYIEIGYTPRELASSSHTLGFSYHPYTGVPTSYRKYGDLLRAFLLHNLQIYGIDSMRHWRFDFWNTANLHSSNGFWGGTQEEFFRFYREVYRVFREVHKELALGTPNFSLPDGIDWYEAFFQMCRKEKITPDFVSIHLYSCMDDLEHFTSIFPYPSMTYNYLSLTNTEYLRNIINFLKDVMKKYGYDGLPVIAGEWNITYYLQDLARDTAFMAAYIAHSYLQMIGLLDGYSYFCLSDINDQTRPSNLVFAGNSGLISRHGIVKPAYYAFYLLHKLDADIIELTPPCIVTRSEKGFHVLVYNISEYKKSDPGSSLEFLSDKHRYQVFQDTDTIHFHGSFSVPHGDYSLKTYMVDQEHGSPYDTWLRMGSPEPLSDETIRALLHASFLDIHYDRQNHTSQLTLEGKVPVHGILLFEIEKI